MRKQILKLLTAAVIAAVPFVQADVGVTPAAKELAKVVEEGPYVETSQRGIKLSGYVDAGYQYNFSSFNGAQALHGGAPNSVWGHKLPTDSQPRGDFDLNAVKIALEKPLSDANELQAGFRVDLMMGEDVSSLGGTNGGNGSQFSDNIFLQQAYVQFRAPVGNGLDFKVGKFVSLLGYEVMERPANLNISYGNLFALNPRWHTGVLTSYRFNDIVDAKFGVVNGWNIDNNLGSFGNEGWDGYGFTGAVNVTAPGGNANIQNAFYYSFNEGGPVLGNNTSSPDNGTVFVWDMWGNWAPKFANDKLLLGFNTVFGVADVSTNESHYPGTGGPNDETTWWGVALYSKYQFTDIFSLAGRFDYMHNDDGMKFGNDPDLFECNEDVWSWTLTAGFDIIENMMLRVEYRGDLGVDIEGSRGHDGIAHQTTLQVVYTF